MQFKIDAILAQQVINYLAERPYREVANLIPALASIEQIPDAPAAVGPYQALLACYRSGQIIEAAWQDHLKTDKTFKVWLDAQSAEQSSST